MIVLWEEQMLVEDVVVVEEWPGLMVMKVVWVEVEVKESMDVKAEDL